jgi:protein-tyrosine phosphatase
LRNKVIKNTRGNQQQQQQQQYYQQYPQQQYYQQPYQQQTQTQAYQQPQTQTYQQQTYQQPQQQTTYSTTTEPTQIVSPYLYVGSSYSNDNPQVLLNLGITHILNVSAETPVNVYKINWRIKWKQIKMENTETYNARYIFEEAFAFIEEGRNYGKVLVHCNDGISRSPTIVMAYIMYRYRSSLQSAYQRLQTYRPCVKPNDNFYRQLYAYELELKNLNTPA